MSHYDGHLYRVEADSGDGWMPFGPAAPWKDAPSAFEYARRARAAHPIRSFRVVRSAPVQWDIAPGYGPYVVQETA